MKKLLWLFLSIGCVFNLLGCENNKKTLTNKEEQKEVVDEYAKYEFTDIKTYDGEIIYNNKEEFSSDEFYKKYSVYQDTFIIDYDGSVYLNDQEKFKDINGDDLYIQNISLFTENYTTYSVYMLDRQGYLYVYEVTETGKNFKKSSDNKVIKIGSMNNNNNYAYMFEDNTVLEVTKLVEL